MSRFSQYTRSSLRSCVGAVLFFVLLSITCIDYSTAFAAAKKKQKGGPSGSNKRTNSAASSNKGFGTKPAQVFSEVVSTFRTRLPQDANDLPCPCGSGSTGSTATYASCCAPYHTGAKRPETPTAVLRSRYTAFCWRLVPYILDTTHPVCRDYRDNRISWAQDLNKAGMFDSYEFVGLEDIGPEERRKALSPSRNAKDDAASTDDEDDEVCVEFKVRLRARTRVNDVTLSLEGQETVISEKSRFLRTPDGSWLYAGGDVRSNVQGLQNTVLNP